MFNVFSFTKLNYASVLESNVYQNRNDYRSRTSCISAVLGQNKENNSSCNLPEPKKSSGSSSGAVLKRCQKNPNTVGILGGVSAFSTLVFLEKLVWWSTRNGQDCIPFLVCSDASLSAVLQSRGSLFPQLCFDPLVENLREKRRFLEQSGACCIVMPCTVSHTWHDHISAGCLLPFFHVGECVASELKAAGLKSPEAGSIVSIGVLATKATLDAGFYQDKLQSQGFEVVLPDKATIDNILIPAVEAMRRKDPEGARILLRIAIRVLLMRAVKVILASEEIQSLLPHNDPLLKKCINPMDSLVRSTLKWAKLIQHGSTWLLHKEQGIGDLTLEDP